MGVAYNLSEAQLALSIDGSDSGRFLVMRYRGVEGLCQLYRFQLDLVSDDSLAAFDEVVGRSALLKINTPHGTRCFHGIINRFEYAGPSVDQHVYRAELVPQAWRLTQRYNSRIFQDKNIQDIVTDVMTQADLAADALRFDLLNTYEPRTYCVQYRETDYNFIARLMEEEGIWWYFEQSEAGHILVMADSPAAYAPMEGDPALPFHLPTAMNTSAEHVFAFQIGQTVRPGAVRLNDFNFAYPKLDLNSSGDAGRDTDLIYRDCPGKYGSQSEGNPIAQRRVEEFEAARTVGTGKSDCHRLSVGRSFELIEHPSQALNSSYLVTALTHHGKQAVNRTTVSLNGSMGASRSYMNGSSSNRASKQWLYHAGKASGKLDVFGPADPNADLFGAGEHGDILDSNAPVYECRFECIPASVTYRPARVTPWPDMRGTQTARVVGPESEEIYTDEYGRVKVQFNWDSEGQFNEHSSCWIRVSQGMAGGQYGMMFLPRVGQEVVVDFLDGDPDQPLIIGRVYNADHMPPYPLPDEKTKSVIKTHSSKGGGGTNEIRFEDLKGSEQLLFHAEKDLHVRVKNDRVESVGHDHHLTVERHRFALIKQCDHVEVRLDRYEKIGGDKNLVVDGDVAEFVKGNHGKVVSNIYDLHAYSDVVIWSETAVTLKVGGNFIKIDPTGIYIMGTVVHINSEGSAGQGIGGAAASHPTAPLEADTVEPGKDNRYGPSAQEPASANGSGMASSQSTEPDEEKLTSWIEIELVDEAGQPWPNERYEIIEPDGTVHTGTLDLNGQAHVAVTNPGECQISFPNLDRRAWERT